MTLTTQRVIEDIDFVTPDIDGMTAAEDVPIGTPIVVHVLVVITIVTV